MARKGAEHRYEELKAEIATLVKHFPHLASKARATVANASRAIEAEGQEVRRRGRKMSVAARKAVSARMKRYWAARRKAESKGQR